ncbi:hypothetical protein CK203_082206 [Vitis vinifera]|uniref:DUF4283 domain-containing protein n=1 Tax=Vitis vinifera TaxID=29760 RepID=A0A438CNG5_VITVI|nr:hypothetical protein CK203_082206 [Vitis vinifera]
MEGGCVLGGKGFWGSLISILLIFDRTLGGESFDHSGDWNEEGRADNTMWLTVYEGCIERSNGCREVGANESNSDKGSGMSGFRKILEWKAVNAEGASGGILICLDKRSLEILDWEEGQFTLSCRFRNVENGAIWIFTGVYGLFSKVEREALWDELGAIRGLWEDPWGRIYLEWGTKQLGLGKIGQVEGFKELVRSWWQGIEVRGSGSYKLATKMKEIKQKLKVWNREVFGKLENKKCLALQQVEF